MRFRAPVQCDRRRRTIGGYLPKVFERFGSDHPAVIEAYRDLVERLHEAGLLSARERRLAKLGIAIGRESEGGVRSHARKALAEGIEREAIRQVALLAISTGGYPAAMAAYGWINEVLDREG
jgi:alkylhydroperoxidase/carboxymuconolactone decarboxylase family protein YurZ